MSEKCVADTYSDSKIATVISAMVERRRRPTSRVNTRDNIARGDGIHDPPVFAAVQRPGDEGIRQLCVLSQPPDKHGLLKKHNGCLCDKKLEVGTPF